jgi:hypothetical protein
MMMREILSRQLALSKGSGLLKKGHVNPRHLVFTGALRHTLHHHFTHKRNGNAPDAI